MADQRNISGTTSGDNIKLDNVLLFVDRNSLQMCGRTVDVMCYEPLRQRWEAFGWSVREIDGHDMRQIVENACDIPFEKDKPSVIIADTTKSKCLPFAEDKAEYHYWTATEKEMKIADQCLLEIEEGIG